MKNTLILALALISSAAIAAPGALSTLKFDPPAPKAGQEVKITVGVDGDSPGFCGLRLAFGDGTDTGVKIESPKTTFPLTVNKTYAKAGTYTVKAFGKKITTHLPCNGSVEQQLVVEAVPDAAAPAATGAPACPTSYKLKGKAGKAGDFTCLAGKGAQKPEKMLECKEGLEYFQTKTTLGCRKERK